MIYHKIVGMDRLYDHIALNHFDEDDQMLFLAGPKRCGKTTSAKHIIQQYPNSLYLNWDLKEHSKLITAGQTNVAELVLKDCNWRKTLDCI